MPSQTDLDQGGTQRRWIMQYLGPTIGWVRAPAQNYIGSPGNTTTIVAAGTYQIDLATNFIQVSVAGVVIIILPSARTGNGSPQPGLAVGVPVTIVDVGGNALAHPITIQPISVAETILGLAQIQITTNYGGFILEPSRALSGWVNAQ